jgi:hypothetical protein
MTSLRSSRFAWGLPLLSALVLTALVLLPQPAGCADDEPDPEPPSKWPKTTLAHRAVSVNNLKQLAIAFHNFTDTYGAMPAAAAICDKAGKPLLSWRVALLPYIEQANLYKEFKFDEPWDSKHNKKLLARMPKIYAPTISGKPRKPYTTYYQIFTGPNTPFNQRAARLKAPYCFGKNIPATFPDGTSNTFLIAEAGKPVPWTKPVDIAYDVKKAVPKLGGLFPEGFHVAVADGSTRYISRKIAARELRLLIDPADGQPIDWTKVPEAKLPRK